MDSGVFRVCLKTAELFWLGWPDCAGPWLESGAKELFWLGWPDCCGFWLESGRTELPWPSGCGWLVPSVESGAAGLPWPNSWDSGVFCVAWGLADFSFSTL